MYRTIPTRQFDNGTVRVCTIADVALLRCPKDVHFDVTTTPHEVMRPRGRRDPTQTGGASYSELRDRGGRLQHEFSSTDIDMDSAFALDSSVSAEDGTSYFRRFVIVRCEKTAFHDARATWLPELDEEPNPTRHGLIAPAAGVPDTAFALSDAGVHCGIQGAPASGVRGSIAHVQVLLNLANVWEYDGVVRAGPFASAEVFDDLCDDQGSIIADALLYTVVISSDVDDMLAANAVLVALQLHCTAAELLPRLDASSREVVASALRTFAYVADADTALGILDILARINVDTPGETDSADIQFVNYNQYR